ncbi:MAG: glycosyltransferase [Flavobacteriaceae bacterium]|nr:glycosyltransferase [Flavobacteriaceae bacterium]
MTRIKKKVCLVTSSLNFGGAERSTATQSVMLNNLGYDVIIVTVLSGVAYNYSGTIFNLGELKDKDNTFIGRISRLIQFSKFLKEEKFDFIIDNRSRVQAYREFIISKIIYNAPTIYVIHSFEKNAAFTKHKWLNKLLYKNEMMVAVSKAGMQKFKNLFELKQITTIYNAFDFRYIINQSQLSVDDLGLDKYIIYYGRIHNKAKNLKLLLDAYKRTRLLKEDIKLFILGDGEDLTLIKDYAKQLRLENKVVFKGFINNPYPYVKNALFTVLSSRSEGFAMVIPESLSLETPVVSVNCEAGPKEIIINDYNGLLANNFNSEALGNAMDRLFFDNILYKKCQANAKQSVEKFSIEKITKDWEELLSQKKI